MGGGDQQKITAALLLQAYASGVFPMADGARSNTIIWVDPRRRGVLPLDRLHVPRRLARSFRTTRFDIRINGDFAGVVAACGRGKEGRDTWVRACVSDLESDSRCETNDGQ
jgi:leucyl/phenylalanyl-tRNA--protein transferase